MHACLHLPLHLGQRLQQHGQQPKPRRMDEARVVRRVPRLVRFLDAVLRTDFVRGIYNMLTKYLKKVLKDIPVVLHVYVDTPAPIAQLVRASVL